MAKLCFFAFTAIFVPTMIKYKIDLDSIDKRLTTLLMTPEELYSRIGISRRTWQIIRRRKEATYPVITGIAYELRIDPYENIILGSCQEKYSNEEENTEE